MSVLLTWYHARIQEGNRKKKSETKQILHASFTITHTHLIHPDIAQEIYYTTEIALKRAQNSETLVSPQSVNSWSVCSHVFSTGKSYWNSRKRHSISDIQKSVKYDTVWFFYERWITLESYTEWKRFLGQINNILEYISNSFMNSSLYMDCNKNIETQNLQVFRHKLNFLAYSVPLKPIKWTISGSNFSTLKW